MLCYNRYVIEFVFYYIFLCVFNKSKYKIFFRRNYYGKKVFGNAFMRRDGIIVLRRRRPFLRRKAICSAMILKIAATLALRFRRVAETNWDAN